MNKLEKIVEGGVVKVRVVGSPGKASHPLMSSNGQFFINVGAAAKAFVLSSATINNAIKSGRPVKGQTIRLATEQEVDRFIAVKISAPAHLPPSPAPNKLDFAPGKLYEGKIAADGSVTLTRRLAGLAEVPRDILNDIEWNTSA
jgi:hypothetical protein